MRGFLLLSLFAVGAWCAPLGELDDDQNVAAVAAEDMSDNDIRVKRAKEAIMFGNQQNEAKELKKRVDPEFENEAIDKGAKVIVKDPVDVDRVEDTGANVPEETKVIEENLEEPGVESEEEETVINETPTGTEIEAVSSDEVNPETLDDSDLADVDYQEYLKQLNEDEGYLSQYYNMLNNANLRDYGPSSNVYDLLPLGYLRPRYRRGVKGQFVASNYPRSSLHLKRNHRTKRSFLYPYEEQEYAPLDDSYLNRPYSNYQYLDEPELVSDDDVDDDVVQFLSRYGNYLTPYDVYADDSDDVDDDDFIWNSYPTPYKRQADLAYVPGIKRSRDFYPYFPEPGTHFQAFVPQKRSSSLDDYIDAYQKVMELAAALRANSYYPEEYELEYQKK